MKKVISAGLFVIAFTVVFAGNALAQKSVAGEWDAEFNTPGGPQPLKLIIKVDGEKISGTAKRSRGDVAISGTIKGEDIVFGYTIDYNGTSAQTVAAFTYNNLTISGARATNNVTLQPSGMPARTL